MKNIGNLLTILTIILTSNIFAQLELLTYTDKSDYQYGERQYIRIDSTNATVWEYWAGGEDFLLAELSCSKGDIWGEYFECIKDTTLNIFKSERRAKYIQNNIVFTSGKVIRNYIYAFGIGQISLEREEVNEVASARKANLVYANIDGQEYGKNPNSVQSVNNQNLNFSLEQNYPNPFGEAIPTGNPSTTIKYSLSFVERKSSFAQTTAGLNKVQSEDNLYNVTLKVYDILGREIVTLVNQKQRPGCYEVKFNATDLGSGIYFYKLSTSNFVETKKMILLR